MFLLRRVAVAPINGHDEDPEVKKEDLKQNLEAFTKDNVRKQKKIKVINKVIIAK